MRGPGQMLTACASVAPYSSNTEIRPGPVIGRKASQPHAENRQTTEEHMRNAQLT